MDYTQTLNWGIFILCAFITALLISLAVRLLVKRYMAYAGAVWVLSLFVLHLTLVSGRMISAYNKAGTYSDFQAELEKVQQEVGVVTVATKQEEALDKYIILVDKDGTIVSIEKETA